MSSSSGLVFLWLFGFIFPFSLVFAANLLGVFYRLSVFSGVEGFPVVYSDEYGVSPFGGISGVLILVFEAAVFQVFYDGFASPSDFLGFNGVWGWFFLMTAVALGWCVVSLESNSGTETDLKVGSIVRWWRRMEVVSSGAFLTLVELGGWVYSLVSGWSLIHFFSVVYSLSWSFHCSVVLWGFAWILSLGLFGQLVFLVFGVGVFMVFSGFGMLYTGWAACIQIGLRGGLLVYWLGFVVLKPFMMGFSWCTGMWVLSWDLSFGVCFCLVYVMVSCTHLVFAGIVCWWIWFCLPSWLGWFWWCFHPHRYATYGDVISLLSLSILECWIRVGSTTMLLAETAVQCLCIMVV